MGVAEITKSNGLLYNMGIVNLCTHYGAVKFVVFNIPNYINVPLTSQLFKSILSNCSSIFSGRNKDNLVDGASFMLAPTHT